jgi:hypothetical protein
MIPLFVGRGRLFVSNLILVRRKHAPAAFAGGELLALLCRRAAVLWQLKGLEPTGIVQHMNDILKCLHSPAGVVPPQTLRRAISWPHMQAGRPDSAHDARDSEGPPAVLHHAPDQQRIGACPAPAVRLPPPLPFHQRPPEGGHQVASDRFPWTLPPKPLKLM